MKRTVLSEGITRITLAPEDVSGFQPVCFTDGGGEYLRQAGFRCAERPVYRLRPEGGEGDVRQTANGEVVVFGEGGADLLRISHSAELRFACPEGQILTGLGQHEEGIFDYARKEERLYQHNMKIAVPFLLSSAGWGLLIEAGCAMRYRGEGDGFVFFLDAAEEFSYTVIRAGNCAEVLKKLSSLTGRPALLPKWAYGYIQSKERYKTAAELTETASEFRRRGLGLDCIVLDWCSWRDGCWGDKTPDPERFPDVRQDLYWKQCRRTWMSCGTDALWCDSDEPITDPDWCGTEKRDEDERMRLLTEASSVRMDPERMNGYGAAHLRGLYEHWRKDLPDRRPVILSRSGGPDSGALGTILWSGDVAARWDVLRKQVTEAIRTACSGICWWTLDIGAFFVSRGEQWFWRGDYPDGVRDPGYRELYIRWFQFGAMLPVFRSHGTDTPREPWQFGAEDSPEYACIRDMIALRYRLMPYLYATAAQAAREGLPMIRAMMAAFPDAPELYAADDLYMLGDALLVKPVTRALADGGSAAEVQLPPGGWYDWFTGEYAEGGQTVRTAAPLDRFPLFVRAGGILPVAEGARCAADLPVPAREILVFGGADGAFELYDDSGDGYEEGITIPIRWMESRKTLILGRAAGRLPEAGCMTVRLTEPGGRHVTRQAVYDGGERRISFAEE